LGPLGITRHESELGRWIQASWSPAIGTELHGGVQRIWYFEGVLVARRERIFPDGSIEIIVQLDEPHRPGDGGDPQGFPPVCVTGLRLTSEVVVAPRGHCRVLGLVLSPQCAHLVVRESLALLTGITADLQDLVGREASELAERLEDAGDPAACIAAARAWVSARIARARSMKRSFREMFGTTPKRYQRILRFRDALDALAGNRGSLADIAAAHGYYDQAHFTNEFREHAGMSPTAFLRASAFPGGTSLAEG
jgi:AraC-like DNA-binding protein